MRGRILIGTSGWNYKAWANDVFYPAGLKTSDWLDFYAQRFDSVEINNSFYHLPQKRVFESWRKQTPDKFVFAVKASRFITHMKKLLEPGDHVSLFLERASGLREKLGVVLFQLPPFWRLNRERLTAFCEYLSRQKIVPGLHAALEVRNPSWMNEAVLETLRAHNVALALADWPAVKVSGPLTADFVFMRRHGPEGLYSSNYSDELLERKATQIRTWREEGRDVHVYFNNDVHGFAVKNAATLKRMVE